MTESLRVPRVPQAEMTESSRVPRVLEAEVTETLRVSWVLKGVMADSLRVPGRFQYVPCNISVRSYIDTFKCIICICTYGFTWICIPYICLSGLASRFPLLKTGIFCFPAVSFVYFVCIRTIRILFVAPPPQLKKG